MLLTSTTFVTNILNQQLLWPIFWINKKVKTLDL